MKARERERERESERGGTGRTEPMFADLPTAALEARRCPPKNFAIPVAWLQEGFPYGEPCGQIMGVWIIQGFYKMIR